MIAHHHVSDDAKTEETLKLAPECDKMLILSIPEDETGG